MTIWEPHCMDDPNLDRSQLAPAWKLSRWQRFELWLALHKYFELFVFAGSGLAVLAMFFGFVRIARGF